MTDIYPSIVLEDSKGNRYFFYYKDSSIYYREVPRTGDTKDTILISQANENYAAAIDTDDSIYLTCNSRYKGVLLFIYTKNGWKFEPVVNSHNNSGIYIMDIIVQNGSIHIFFSKKLPVANMYNVYHIHKNINEQTPYIEYSWRKNSLSEIYSQNIENSYSLLALKNGIIHYASVWYDGTHYYVNYYCYDDSIKSWLHKSLSISYKNQVFIKLIHHNKKINLICFSNESEASNIHHFINKSSGNSDIDFKEFSNSRVNTNGIVPLFYSDDKAIQLAWIKDRVFHQYFYDDSSGKWKNTIDLPITADTNILVFKIIKNSGHLSITRGYFIIDKNHNISKPVEHLSRNVVENKTNEKLQTASAPVPDMNDYLKQILFEIKDLSENVRNINNRIDNLENNTYVQKAYKEESKEILPVKPKTPSCNDIEYPALKKSSFKEKFMNNERPPSYKNLLMKQENINTYVGKPSSDTKTDEASRKIKAGPDASDSGKQAFSAPSPMSQQYSADKNSEAEEITHEYVNLFKKIGEFFK